MILFRNFTSQVIATEGTVFKLLGQNPNGAGFMLENRDALNYISYRFQQSVDGVTFTDLAAEGGNQSVTGILAPGQQAMVIVRSTSAFFRMQASSSGGATIDVGMIQFSTNGSSTFNLGTM